MLKRFLFLSALALSTPLSLAAESVDADPASNTAEAVRSQPNHFVKRFLDMSEAGDTEGVQKVLESITLLLSGHAQKQGIGQTEFNSLSAAEVDALIAEVFNDAGNWTLEDLHEKARPMREIALKAMEDKALESKTDLLEKKRQIEVFLQAEDDITLGAMQRGFEEDEFGYPRGFMQTTITNGSQDVLTHIELYVMATGNDVGRGILYLKVPEGLGPGETGKARAYPDPTSELGEAFAQANSNDVGFKIQAFYFKGLGRVHRAKWTEDMADTLKLAMEAERKRAGKP